MGFSRVNAAMISGLDVRMIQVETDVSAGLPVFHIVGYAAADVKEAIHRVMTAVKNSGIQMPVRRIVVNLSPADIRKRGASFDLPIAVSILLSMGLIPSGRAGRCLFLGELGLDGSIRPVRGVLPIVMEARSQKMKACILPADNLAEAQIVTEMNSIGFSRLDALIRYLRTGESHVNTFGQIEEDKEMGGTAHGSDGRGDGAAVGLDSRVCSKGEDDWESGDVPDSDKTIPDFADIQGQEVLKRACLISAAGRHNLLMIGPPGSGKTMAACRLPGILPSMSRDECFEVTKIYSVLGMLDPAHPLISRRPFRTVHHSSTASALTGGGMIPFPGEISMAHKGVLFLDELMEFKRNVLEMLRQPIEQKMMVISRRQWTYSFPADFLLVCAANPCPCGYYPDRNRCRCSEQEIDSYMGRVSGPLLDRIDLCVQVEKVEGAALFNGSPSMTSAGMKKSVEAACLFRARRCQERVRSKEEDGLKGRIGGLGLTDGAIRLLEGSYDHMGLTARTLVKTAGVARTIADLEQCVSVEEPHVLEALSYRFVK